MRTLVFNVEAQKMEDKDDLPIDCHITFNVQYREFQENTYEPRTIHISISDVVSVIVRSQQIPTEEFKNKYVVIFYDRENKKHLEYSLDEYITYLEISGHLYEMFLNSVLL